MAIVLGQKFASFRDLQEAIQKYENENFVKLWRRSSRTIDYAKRNGLASASKGKEELVYCNIKYACINGGVKYRTSGTGQRNTSTFRQDCPAHIFVSLSEDRQALVIKSLNETHNHEISKELYKNLFHQRRLNAEERKRVADLLSLNISKKEIANAIQAETNKVILVKDVKNIHQQINRKSCTNNLENTISILRDKHKAFVDTFIVDNTFKGLFFQDENMKKSFESYPEFLCCDTTCELLELGLSCFLLLVEDSNGQSEIVGVGLLVQEDKDSLHWLLSTFAEQNPEVSETQVIMSGSDMKERDVLKNVFPDAHLVRCRFHTMKTFRRQLTCEKFDITPDQRNLILELLQKLVYAKSIEQYHILYSQLTEYAPPTILEYFDLNWHPIRSEWILCSDSGSFLNFTNTKLQAINSKLRGVINRNTSLEEFVDKFYIIFYSMCKEKDSKILKIIQKTPVRKFLVSSAENKYRSFLTPYAFQMVMKQLSACETVRKIESKPETDVYVVHTLEGSVDTGLMHCTCSFNSSINLPCCHIFALRKSLCIDLFDENCCSRRWTAAYYKKTHRIFRSQSMAESFQEFEIKTEPSNDGFMAAGLPERRNLSGFEKFKKAEIVTAELAVVLAQCSDDQYENRLKLLKQLLELWKTGEDVCVVQIDGDVVHPSEVVENEQITGIQVQEDHDFTPVVVFESEVKVTENAQIYGDHTYTPVQGVILEDVQDGYCFTPPAVLEIELVENSEENSAFIMKSEDMSLDNSSTELRVQEYGRLEVLDHSGSSISAKRQKVEEPLPFWKESVKDKQSVILSWFVDNNVFAKCLNEEYIVQKSDIACNHETLTPAVLHKCVTLSTVQNFFSCDAWRHLLRIYEWKKKLHKWSCKVCSKELEVSESLCCEKCLLREHLGCSGVSSPPKLEPWFCRLCVSSDS